MTYQAPIAGLHSPTLLLFLQNSTDYLMLAKSCKFGVICCFIGLTHPAACTRVRGASDFWTCPQTPPFTQFTQKGCQSTGLELRIPMVCLKLRGSGPEQNWRPLKTKTTPGYHPKPPLSNSTHIYIPIDSSRRQDSKYVIYISIDMCRQKVMILDASWYFKAISGVPIFDRK